MTAYHFLFSTVLAEEPNSNIKTVGMKAISDLITVCFFCFFCFPFLRDWQLFWTGSWRKSLDQWWEPIISWRYGELKKNAFRHGYFCALHSNKFLFPHLLAPKFQITTITWQCWQFKFLLNSVYFIGPPSFSYFLLFFVCFYLLFGTQQGQWCQHHSTIAADVFWSSYRTHRKKMK